MKQIVILAILLTLGGFSAAVAQQVDKTTYPLKALFPDEPTSTVKAAARKADVKQLPEARVTNGQGILELIFKTLPPATSSKPATVITPDNGKLASGINSADLEKTLKANTEQLKTSTTIPVMQQSPDSRPTNASKPQN